MEMKEFVLSFLNCIWNKEDIAKVYHFLTKDTVFYCIGSKKELSLEEFIKMVMPYQDYEYRILESRVCLKLIFYKEEDTKALYFESAKRKRMTRVEIE